MYILEHLKEKKVDFSLVLVQSAIQNRVEKMRIDNQLQKLHYHKIPTMVVSEGAVSTIAPSVQVLLLGADALTVNGGLINTTGTQQLARIVKQFTGIKMIVTASFTKLIKDRYATNAEFIERNPESYRVQYYG